jgi:hypothetical protein
MSRQVTESRTERGVYSSLHGFLSLQTELSNYDNGRNLNSCGHWKKKYQATFRIAGLESVRTTSSKAP